MNKYADDIINFWFQDIPLVEEIAIEKMAHWWQKDEAFDNEIKRKYLSSLELINPHEAGQAIYSADERLANIILLDQFPRNIFRHHPKSFHYDTLALKIAMEGIELAQDKQLPPIYRVFFYMPFEHSESTSMQEQSISLFSSLVDEAPLAQRAIFDNFLSFAKQHKDVIDKFGRYPHRNAILGRSSSEEELEYLKSHSGF